MAVSEELAGRVRRSSDLTAVGGAGLVALVVGLAIVAGPLGVGAGLAVTALALVLPATHAVALAHVLLLPVVPASTGPRLALWGALLLVLVGPARRLDGGARLAVTALAVAGALWLGTSWIPGRVPTAIALLGVGVAGAAVLHRYAVVTVRFEPGRESHE